jgi:general secretion pathway protein L
MTHDIDELDVQKNHAVVHGIVATVADAQQIRTNLANERCFSDPKITRTTQMVGDTRQKYVLEFDLKCPEDQKGGDKKANAGAGAAASGSAAPTGGK